MRVSGGQNSLNQKLFEPKDALAKAAVEQAWMCGATPVVLLYARDAYARAVSDGAGAGSGRPPIRPETRHVSDNEMFNQKLGW